MHAGGCHCGILSVRFETTRAIDDFEVRECDCSFCQRHRARYLLDPDGSFVVRVADPNALVRYRFALRTADFLICARCGVYVGAISGDRGIVNANALDDRDRLRGSARVGFDGETEASRLERRRSRWMPARVEVV
jgi:hypothetical protein